MAARSALGSPSDLLATPVHSVVQKFATAAPGAVAILAPGGQALSYGGLYRQIQETVRSMNRAGISRGDRVASVLPNGPEMAAAFLGVTAGATIAPLNPALSANEFASVLADLAPRALLVMAGADTPALAAAATLGVPVLRLARVVGGEAGLFTLDGDENSAPAAASGLADADDVALLLYTSGTTSRPKLVPLTHRNLCASAHDNAEAHCLNPRDRCLNLMPLFHAHGLITGLLASLATGASIICPPGFYATDFFRWLEELSPTWYTAGPTMHQSILARAPSHLDSIRRRPLRFIRSSSAPLPPSVLTELEGTFGAPVVEAYGMTEAASQIASNPLPPGVRKPGSVGPAAGPEVAIMGADGVLLPEGSVGEVVIRGPSVMACYADNPLATAAAFTQGWLRTGDHGYLDADRYLFLTGRLKELINRGGEKIAPFEVDEVLLAHPSVAQAVAFAVPHPTLGETVGTAVVLREGTVADEAELRAFAAERLAPFKVPSVIRLVAEIPTGPSGKLQRAGLAEALGLTSRDVKATGGTGDTFVAPSTASERTLRELWAEVLELQPSAISVRDRFLEIGGDSILALRLAVRIEDVMGIRVPLSQFFLAATIVEQARLLADPGLATASKSLVPIQTTGDRVPLFCVHGAFGDVLYYKGLAEALGPRQPIYGLQARGLDGREVPQSRVEEMARTYIDEIRAIQPEGPYCLAGYSAGGSVAFEMAQQFRAAGQRVGLLAILDHCAPGTAHPQTIWSLQYAARWLDNLVGNVPYWLSGGPGVGFRDMPSYLRWHARLVGHILARLLSGRGLRSSEGVERLGEIAEEMGQAYMRIMPEHRKRVLEAQLQAPLLYTPRPYSGQALLFRARRQRLLSAHDPQMGWSGLVQGGLTVVSVPGNHDNLFREPNVALLAKHLSEHLAWV